MIKLYEQPPTRSQRVRWALEELSLDYDSHVVDMMAGEQLTDEYLRIHPLGVVPAIATIDYTMYESVAIVLQLIDENPKHQLAPDLGTPERAMYYQWSVFAAAELDPAIMQYFDNTMRPAAAMRPPGRTHDAKLASQARDDFNQRAKVLSAVLKQQDYMLGAAFSAVDILIGHSCFMATFTKLIAAHPVLQMYHERLQQRPAYQKAYQQPQP